MWVREENKMAVDRPNDDEVEVLATRFGYRYERPELPEVRSLVEGGLAGYDLVDSLYDELVRVPVPERSFRFPSDDENHFGAWYVKTELSTGSEGPLAGRRVAIKDNIAMAGVPMMIGSRSMEGFTPSVDATVVTRALEAGAQILGKAVCEDLCFSGSSFTSASGPVTNPWDPSRTSGGSSSGNAVLLAVGEVDLAVGGDQGGSVRLPASFSGVVGHKPTFGLVPYTGAFPIERTIDHLGPMARTVEDAAMFLSVLAGADGLDPRQNGSEQTSDFAASLGAGVEGLRIGILEEGFGIEALSDPGVDAAVRSAAEALGELGAKVSRISVPWHTRGSAVWSVIATDGATYQMLDGNGYGLGVEGFYDPDQMEFFASGKLAHADEFSETVKITALTGAWGLTRLGGASYGKAQMLVPLLRAAYDEALRSVDVLVLPTTPFTAPKLLEPGDDRATYLTKALNMIANTAPTDVTGHPATSVPVGLVDGLPVGLMVVAPRFEDALGLRVAHAVESQQGSLVPPSARAGTV
jgi:amidase